MEPRAREAESKAVAQHLLYLCTALKLVIPAEVKAAADNYYGDEDKCDEFTALLCNTIQTESVHDVHAIMYDGRKKKSRALADWWETHQIWDEEREAKENLDKERQEVIDSLSDRQRALLNLH